MISSKLLDVKGSKSWSLSIAIWNAITYSFPLRRLAGRRSSWEGRASWPCHLHNHPSTSVHLSGQFSTKLQANVLQAPFKFIHIQYSITVTWNWRLSSWERVHRNWLFRMLQQQIPHIILIQVAVGTLELAPQVNDQIHQQQNHTKPYKTFMSWTLPIEKRSLQRLEALDPSSHWRHARSASLLDFAAAKPSSNLLVVHVPGQSLAHKRNLPQQRREGRHFKHTKLCLSCCGHHSTQVPSLPLISFSDSVIKVKSALKNFGPSKIQDLTRFQPFATMLLWCPPPWHASLEIIPAIISCCFQNVIFRSISEVTTPSEDPRGYTQVPAMAISTRAHGWFTETPRKKKKKHCWFWASCACANTGAFLWAYVSSCVLPPRLCLSTLRHGKLRQLQIVK